MKAELIYKHNFFCFFVALIAAGILSFAIFWDWTISFAVLVILGLLFLFLNNLESGFLLILLSIAFGQLLRVELGAHGGSIIFSDVLIILVDLVWLGRKLIKVEDFKKSIFFGPIVLFVIWAIISGLYSLNFLLPEETLRGSFYLIRWVFYAGLFFVTLDLMSNLKAIKKYWQWIIWIGLIVAFLGFVQLVYVPDFEFMTEFGWDPHEGRLLSTFFDPNLVGGFLAFIISLVFSALFFEVRKKKRLVLGIIGLVLFLALILTFSRSALIGFFISFSVIAFIRSWKIAILGYVILALAILAFPRSLERIQSAAELDRTSQARIESWQEGWQVISEHPLVGVGLNNLPYTKPSLTSKDEEKIAHSASGFDSSILTVWATTGTIGLILYLIIYGLVIWYSFKTYIDQKAPPFIRALGLGVGGGAIGLFFHSQFVNSLFYSPIMILIWVSVGMLMAGREKIDNQKSISKISAIS